ncbi:MAG TPA: hypothetical protein ENI70_00375 [Candidatus Peregrinibacteria bacterium]|nr:hypothetical protein [Candidatus Peregrinibacteria bacterium]
MPRKKSEEIEEPTPIPVILKKIPPEKKGIQNEDLTKRETRYYRQEQLSLDKIVEGSGSQFYITGENTRVTFKDLLDLIEKHDISQVHDIDKEEIVLSSKLLTGIAKADVVEEEEEELRYIDASAIGIFIGGFFISLFSLLTPSASDIHAVSWVIILVSGFFLLSYLYKGIRSGFLRSFVKKWLQKISQK